MGNLRLVAELGKIAARCDITPAQLALSWLLNKQAHVIPIPGTRRIAYLEMNAAASNVVLDADTLIELDRLFDPQAVAGDRYPQAGFVGMERD